MDKEFWKCKDESIRWGYITDEHRKAITLSAMERWKNGRFNISIKERREFDNKKPKEIESELDNLDVDNSCPTSPLKGRNIVDLDIVCKQLLDGCKP